MLKWIFILLVAGGAIISNFSDNSSSSLPTQVQNVAPQVQSGTVKTTVQTEQKVEPIKTAPKPATTSITACGADYYRNVDGNCVHRPSDNPSGASARCRDGSYSYSQNRRGTCSGHGGVSVWY